MAFDMERWRGHTPGLMGAQTGYAVLIPVVCEEGKEPSILFEVRAGTLRRQPGEVCFPGGKMEEGETPVECALRETWEEIGIPPSAIEVVGECDFLFHQAGYLIHPILGKVTGRGTQWDHVNAAEVADTFLVPLSFFEENEPQVWSYDMVPNVPADFPYDALAIPHDYPWRTLKHEVPAWFYEGHVIWGLTARILRDLFRS